MLLFDTTSSTITVNDKYVTFDPVTLRKSIGHISSGTVATYATIDRQYGDLYVMVREGDENREYTFDWEVQVAPSYKMMQAIDD